MRKRLAWHRSGFSGRPDNGFADTIKRASRRVLSFEYPNPTGGGNAQAAKLMLRDLLTGTNAGVLGSIRWNYTFLGGNAALSTNDEWQSLLTVSKSSVPNVAVMVFATVTFQISSNSSGTGVLHVRIGGGDNNPRSSSLGYSREFVNIPGSGTYIVTLHAAMVDFRGLGNVTYSLGVAANGVSDVWVLGAPDLNDPSPSQTYKTAMWLIELGWLP